LSSVLHYNEDIAEYAFFVAPASHDAAFLAKRLITRPSPPRPANVQPARTGQPTGENSYENPATEPRPRTFRGQRGPAEGEPAEEPSAIHRPRAFLRLAAHETPAEPAHGGLYQGLLGAEGAMQAQQLTALLHWDRELPVDAGEKLTLDECLERVPVAQRRAAIAAYWNIREQMALYQVLGERSESLAGLASKLLALRSAPGGAAAMLRLQAARTAAQAAVLDQHLQLTVAQFALVALLNSPPDRPWPLPSTPPHGGTYTVAPSDENQNSTDRVPAGAGTRVLVLHGELTHRARAVVFADEFRALHTPAEPRRPAEIDSVLRAIDRQLRDTEAFLATLTDYNLAVADFVLPLLQPGTTAKGVTGKLIIEPTPKSDG
jgi:hypothetical protein